MTREVAGSLLAALVAMTGVLCAGCASQRRNDPSGVDAKGEPAPSAAVAAAPSAPEALLATDPVAYLESVRERCATLTQYTVLFTRQERRGFGPFKSLQPPEEIQCWFRRSPLSVRMKWLDPEIKYGESTYVEGEWSNKVRFVPRFGLFGLSPGLVRVKLQTPVTWGEARYSVDTFGVEYLVNETLATLRRFPTAVISYKGVVAAPRTVRMAHELRIDYPREENPAPTQQLYFDPATHLPVGTVMTFPDGSIDTAYWYDGLDATVMLTGDDFLLDLEKAAATAVNGDAAR